MLPLARVSIAAWLFATACFSAEKPAHDSLAWIMADGIARPSLPFSLSELVLPRELEAAGAAYHAGDFREVGPKLERYLALNIPDGQTDLYLFMLAESYRAIDAPERANPIYRQIMERFTRSEKVPYALFRLFEDACDRDDLVESDSLFRQFQRCFPAHPLHNAVIYSMAKSYLLNRQIKDAREILAAIPASSVLYAQAQFLTALILAQTGEREKALLILEYVRTQTRDENLLGEIPIIIGDIYNADHNYSAAIDYYDRVPVTASRRHEVLVKKARTLADAGRYKEALDVTQQFMRRHSASPYLFEMVALMERIYSRMGDRSRAAKIGRIVYRQLGMARFALEIGEEKTFVIDISRRWREIAMIAEERGDEAGRKQALRQIERCLQLDKRFNALVPAEAGAKSKGGATPVMIPGWDQQRYLGLLQSAISAIDDSLNDRRLRFDGVDANATDGTAGSARDSATVFERSLDSLRTTRRLLEEELRHIQVAQVKQGSAAYQASLTLQVKFIDWAFSAYQDNKRRLAEMQASRLATERLPKTDVKQRSEKKESQVTPQDLENIAADIVRERRELIAYITKMLGEVPLSPYSTGILLRQAELRYDEAGEAFARHLQVYEQRLAQGADSSQLVFPEFSLDTVIDIYDRILTDFPNDPHADDACFYRGLALQKTGREAEGNDAMGELIATYPESEFYVEANMNIGRYFFEHPKIDENSGYLKAAEAYKRVLAYRDHPQFVEALYHLGWCYYMQDKYEDAIEVFRYLVEDAHLDFDPRRQGDEKQMANPLLRDEAIDYIAISFNEKGRLDDALQFLTLVGNPDYAALVLKRIAELREEDLDYPGATAIYQRLFTDYSLSSVAPEAAVKCIKVLEADKQPEAAQREREAFTLRYGRGSAWHNRQLTRDTVLTHMADSMAIAIGLSIADEQYQRAQSEKADSLFRQAAESYNRIVALYPADPRAAEARWNLAVLMQSQGDRQDRAVKEYIAYSQYDKNDPAKRETSALNAVAVAQRMLPPDSAIRPTVIEPSTALLIDAVNNYRTLFPNGRSLSDVLLVLGSAYFNRALFSQAETTYAILSAGSDKNVGLKACFLTAQCQFSRENWVGAADLFEKARQSPDTAIQREAGNLLIQARYFNAKQVAAQGDYQKAASLFEEIESRYPGSEYGDIVLYNAAESYDKLANWKEACRNYLLVAKRYPLSKFAPDALFNAAGDYEKASKFDKAAEVYETIIAQNSASPRAKDALFNVGFCYEKLGNTSLMAEASERFSQLYPDEKDAEKILLRSAAFYFKAGLWEKAGNAYSNYIKRYNRGSHVIEACYMVGKCAYERKEFSAAEASLRLTEALHSTLAEEGKEADPYYAAEAAFLTGRIKQEAFDRVVFTDPAEIKANQKWKTELLSDAARAYQRVVQYRSERLFEAAFHIGAMYIGFAKAWDEQKRTEKDPIKAALFEKDIRLGTVTLLQNSFEPFTKVVDFCQALDSIKPEVAIWRDSAKTSLAHAYLKTGRMMVSAVEAMQNAPVPKDIQSHILFALQYQKQLLETLEPMKVKARDFYLTAWEGMKKAKLAADSILRCQEEFLRFNFLIPNDYDRLAEKILLNTDQLPKEMSPEAREDLTFQFEDMVFDLQEKAVERYEEATQRAENARCGVSPWMQKITARLARMRPETYGKKFYPTERNVSNHDWMVRSDSVKNWNSTAMPHDGWARALQLRNVSFAAFPADTPSAIWGVDSSDRFFFVKHMAIDGAPREARIHCALQGRYTLYVNGTKVSTDTTGHRVMMELDSITGIVSLFKGGDNIIGLDIAAPSPPLKGGVVMSVAVLVDTTQRFASNFNPPELPPLMPEEPDTLRKDSTAATPVQPVAVETVAPQPFSSAPRFTNRADLVSAIDRHRRAEQTALNEMKTERLAIQKLRIKDDWISKQQEIVRHELDSLRTVMDREEGK
jgi:TolA-binding protein